MALRCVCCLEALQDVDQIFDLKCHDIEGAEPHFACKECTLSIKDPRCPLCRKPFDLSSLQPVHCGTFAGIWRDDVRGAFAHFNVSGSGNISLEEFSAVLNSAREHPPSEEEVKTIFLSKAKQDNCKGLTLNEFAAFLVECDRPARASEEEDGEPIDDTVMTWWDPATWQGCQPHTSGESDLAANCLTGNTVTLTSTHAADRTAKPAGGGITLTATIQEQELSQGASHENSINIW